MAIHHVSVNVSDVDASIAFYTDVLGGSLRDDRPDFSFGGAWIDLGPHQVHLIEGQVPESLGQHFAIQVHDLDDTVAELRASGLTVSDPVPVSANRQAFVNDPDGNTVELHEVGTAVG
jgi:catechol 2,3-dioxygenase-like lactoylglutathione lyase family enzyme